MFKLNENYEADRKILKFDYIRYSPAETSTRNFPISQIYHNIPREDNVISLLNSYLELNFQVFGKADNSRYINGNDINIVNLGPVAFFSSFKLTTSSEKHLEDVRNAHRVTLMCKLKTSSKDSNDLPIGFNRSRNIKRDELTINKYVTGKYHLRIMLKYVIGFVEYQEEVSCGLCFKFTLTRNKEEAVIDKAAGNVDATIKIDHMLYA